MEPRPQRTLEVFRASRVLRARGHCQKCGTFRERLQRDHIIPKFKGGSHDLSNIWWICANCHDDKSRKEQAEARTGVKASEETLEKMRKARAARGPVSLEARAKQSEAMKAYHRRRKGQDEHHIEV